MTFFSAQTSSLKHSDANCTQIIYTPQITHETIHDMTKLQEGVLSQKSAKGFDGVAAQRRRQSLYYLN